LLYRIPIMDVSETSFTEVRGWWYFFFITFCRDVILLAWVGGKSPTLINVPVSRFLTLYYFMYILVIIPALAWYNNLLFHAKQDQDSLES
jgi:quinol-cytochrome oxidoreductase complex cytochrome b subunit